MTSYEVKKKTGWEESDFFYLRMGQMANPVNPSFRRINLYYWKDISEMCLKRGLDVP